MVFRSIQNLSRTGLLPLRSVISVICLAILAATLGTAATAPASAAPLSVRLDLKVLVVHDPSTQAYEDLMTRDGIPFDRIDIADAATITAGTLVDGSGTARYQAVVVPNLETGAGQPWRAALASSRGDLRCPTAGRLRLPQRTGGPQCPGVLGEHGHAHPHRGGGRPGRRCAFSYLRGPVPFDVGSYGYEAAVGTLPAGVTVTQMATGAAGTMVGVIANGGVETMFLTFNANSYQSHLKLLGPGILNWLTGGIHLGLNRSYLAVHADDVLSADSRWSVTRTARRATPPARPRPPTSS